MNFVGMVGRDTIQPIVTGKEGRGLSIQFIPQFSECVSTLSSVCCAQGQIRSSHFPESRPSVSAGMALLLHVEKDLDISSYYFNCF